MAVLRLLAQVTAVLIVGLCLSSKFAASAKAAPASGRAAASFLNIPLSFEANQGQIDPRAQFVSHGKGYSLFLSPGEAYVKLERQSGRRGQAVPDPRNSGSAPVDILRMKLLGADRAAIVAGLDRQAGVVNYFIGNDPKNWHAAIPTYGKVSYAGIYPGVDLVFYGNQSQLEYDFVVTAGADPSRIAWQIEGAALSVDHDGNLLLAAPNGPASFKKPVIYQLDGSKRVPVAGGYAVAGSKVRFALGRYDHAKPLIIDPVLSYLTYLGGAANAYSSTDGQSYIGYWSDGYINSKALAIDKEGDVYVTGNTDSFDFPVKDAFKSSDAALKTDSRATAAYVTKFNPEGTGIVYSTYLAGGGLYNSYGTSIAVDAEGSAYAAGFTDDPGYPTSKGAFQTICGDFPDNGVRVANCEVSGSINGFVTKLNSNGSLAYSTFLGASQAYINAIAVDAEGRAYVAGFNNDYCDPQVPSFECFPTTPGAVQSGLDTSVEFPPNTYYNGFPGDAFLTVFSADGSSLAYSTLLGDNLSLMLTGGLLPGDFRPTYGYAVAVNSAGEFFLTGTTGATKLPVTPGVVQPDPQKSLPDNGVESFVAKFNPIGTKGKQLAYLTYLGPSTDPNYVGSYASGITADSEGEAYVTGYTNSQMFPTTKGAYQNTCGGTPGFDECATAFVVKLDGSGSKFEWSTMFANAPGDNGLSAMGPIQLDAEGDVYIAGATEDDLIPEVHPIQPARGNGQAFVAEFNPEGSKLLFATMVGGLAGSQNAAGLAVDSEHTIYLAGITNSFGVETTKGAFQENAPGSGVDGFVARIAAHGVAATKLTLSPAPAVPGQQVTLTAVVAGPEFGSVPAGTITFEEGTKILGAVKLDSTGTANYKASGLKVGSYTFTAKYGGDETYPAGISNTKKLTVSKVATTTTLKISPNPAKVKQAVTFTATVKTPAGSRVPTGIVTFFAGTKPLSQVWLNASGEATYTKSTLAAGSYSVTAVYAGSSIFDASASKAVTLKIDTTAAAISRDASAIH
jgi:hypothetical protein